MEPIKPNSLIQQPTLSEKTKKTETKQQKRDESQVEGKAIDFRAVSTASVNFSSF